MKVYFLRRHLLVPLTVLGVTFLVFAITRVMPGSPLERELSAAAAGTSDGGGSGGRGQSGSISDEQIEAFEREYLYDKPLPLAYLTWLGLYPRDRLHSETEFKPVNLGGKVSEEKIGGNLVSDPENQVLISLAGTGRPVIVQRDGDEILWAKYAEKGVPSSDWKEIQEDGWEVRYETQQDRFEAYHARNKDTRKELDQFLPRAVIYKSRISGLLQGDLGRSNAFGEPVLGLIFSRMPVALYFGILTAIFTYGVCLPLGVIKAIKHRTVTDNLTSILIFVGYAIPGFALGALLYVYLGVVKPVFPIVGLTSENFDSLSTVAKVKDIAMHTVLPLLSYLVGSFAVTTMMMKNNLMDNLAADYVRTAVSKGVSFNRAVFRHAFRNSFIPIATSLGSLITMIVSGSLLIEIIFDIQGFGLLQYRAITEPDQMLIMGTLTFASFLMVMGNILSDILVALIDPRVKFQ